MKIKSAKCNKKIKIKSCDRVSATEYCTDAQKKKGRKKEKMLAEAESTADGGGE